MRFPNSVDDLLASLDEQYPEVTAQPGDDPQEVFQKALQRGVITRLKKWRARALQDSINPPPVRKRGQGRNVRS